MIQCACGQEAVLKLYVQYRYPRTEWLPEAADPYYVHGFGYRVETCGNPQCEPDAILACREEIIDDSVLLRGSWMPCGLTDQQIAGLEIKAVLSPEDGAKALGEGWEAA